MSRIGKQPIQFPEGVTVSHTANLITVKGPKGELTQILTPHVHVVSDEKSVSVSIPEDKMNIREFKSFWGLTRSLIANMITGVSTGYKRDLEMKGIGYRAQMQGENLVLSVGYSHQVIIEKEAGITIIVADNTNISINGIDKQRVGQIAANIRKIRPPEPYKGKGIKYKDEIIRRKAGKSGKGGKGGK